MAIQKNYPFIDLFVAGMMSFNAHKHVQNDSDLKSLLVFMILFKDTIKELDYYGSDLSYENISGVMKSKYSEDHGRYIYTDESRPKVLFAPPGFENLLENKPSQVVGAALQQSDNSHSVRASQAPRDLGD